MITKELKADRVSVIYMYAGIERTLKGKWVHQYIRLTEGEVTAGLNLAAAVNEDDRTRLYTKQIFNCSVGSIFAIEARKDNDGSTFTSTAQYIGRQVNQETLMYFAARQEGNQRTKENERGKNEDAIYECLEPIRRAIRLQGAPRRAAMIAKVVRILMNEK